jgi:3-hydroxyisobutyrate dehydrogenase-like beta-hydroxyacid dehydrogenase
MAKRKVGVGGLGNMVGAVARNLANAGVTLMVWDAARKAREAFSALLKVSRKRVRTARKTDYLRNRCLLG